MNPTARGKLKSEIEAIEGALHDSWSQTDRLTAILAAADKYAEERVKETLAVVCSSCAAWQKDRGYRGCAAHVKALNTAITAQQQATGIPKETSVTQQVKGEKE